MSWHRMCGKTQKGGLVLPEYRFASGKPSALVIDIGASQASVTATHDGMILKKGQSGEGV